jgi:flagella basal body P-ring formation protein FlgA
MVRLVLTLLAGLLAGLPALAADPALLRPSAVIEGDAVRLGDLFENAGPKAQTVVVAAPQPGRRIVLGAEWLARVAAAHGLAWTPATGADRITIERASQTVQADLIAAEVKRALIASGAPDPCEVMLVNRHAEIHLPAGEDARIAVRDVDYDKRSGRFAATIEAPGSSFPVRARVSGRVVAVVDLPVLSHQMQRGEKITDADLEWQQVPETQAQFGILTRREDIIGRLLRTVGRPGVPLRTTDLAREVVVAKGSMVTIVLRAGSLQLTAQGRALEDGGLGDTIKVTNLQSKLTVEGKVEGSSTVSVVPMGHVAN